MRGNHKRAFIGYSNGSLEEFISDKLNAQNELLNRVSRNTGTNSKSPEGNGKSSHSGYGNLNELFVKGYNILPEECFSLNIFGNSKFVLKQLKWCFSEEELRLILNQLKKTKLKFPPYNCENIENVTVDFLRSLLKPDEETFCLDSYEEYEDAAEAVEKFERELIEKRVKLVSRVNKIDKMRLPKNNK